VNRPHDFKVELTIDEVRVLYYSVSEALRLWPGSPQRPAEEQDLLARTKMLLFAMLMDVNFESEGGSKE
jgi:hypothetical protein